MEKKYQIEDDELAAGMAAIYMLLKSKNSSPRTVDSWALASRLEATNSVSEKIIQPFGYLPGCLSGQWQKSLLVSKTSKALACLLISILLLALINILGCGSNSALARNFKFQSHIVRIGLALNIGSAVIGTPDGARVRDLATGELIAELPAQTTWKVSPQFSQFVQSAQPGQIAFCGTPGQPPANILIGKLQKYTPEQYAQVNYSAGAAVAATQSPDNFTVPLSFAPKSATKPIAEDGAGLPNSPYQNMGEQGYLIVADHDDGLIALNNKLYRGAIWIGAAPLANNSGSSNSNNKLINAVNYIDIEDYLLSVVPSEMPSGWPLEALKAQSVSARSYAMANIGKHEAEGYDLKATTDDQVYSGVSTEAEATNLAVAETTNLVLKQQDKIIPAFFHSTSGGITEVAENVWGQPLPFLQSVPDYDDNSPLFSWTRNLDIPKLEESLSKDGKGVGQILSLMVLSRSSSLRVKDVLLNGTSGVKVVNGETLRRLFNLPSTNFNIGCVDGGYVIAGRGFGHGLGLSQWGAKSLAEHGYNAAQILTYYYKDVSIDHL